MIFGKMRWDRFLGAPLILALLANGCTKDKSWEDDDEQESECTERACYSQCLHSEWVGLDPYWSLSARCVEDLYDEVYCSCDTMCDDVLCNTYCQTERGYPGGACNPVSCTCSYFSGDAGDSDSGTTAPPDAGG